jgi:hypothetical protein
MTPPKPLSTFLNGAGLMRFAVFAACACGQSNGDRSDATDRRADTEGSELWANVQVSAGSVDADWAAQWPLGVKPAGVGAALIEELAEGEVIDLAWAQQSAVACFPANQDDLFSGPHRFFAVQQAADQGLVISVAPEPGVDLSLYTLQVATNFFGVPPDIQNAVTCDTALKAGAGEAEVRSLWGPNNPYNVIVGVAGVQGQNTGRFLLEVRPAE